MEEAASPSIASDTSSPTRRQVLLRRPLAAVPSTSEIPSEGDSAVGGEAAGRRQVLLAHKIRPGQTIQLKGKNETLTMPDTGTPDLQSESTINASAKPVGPQYDSETGALKSFSVLGPVEEFMEGLNNEAMATGTAAEFYSLAHAPPPAPATAVADATAGADLMQHHLLEQLEATEGIARTKNELTLQRQQAAEALKVKQARAWERQLDALAMSTGMPKSSLQMARSADYRGRVQQREVLEALRRRQHPYGGDRAWQIGLRNGGVFYEAIGNASNGIFCPSARPTTRRPRARARLRGARRRG